MLGIAVLITLAVLYGLWRFLKIPEILAARKADKDFAEAEALAEEIKKSTYIPYRYPDNLMTATEVKQKMDEMDREVRFRLQPQHEFTSAACAVTSVPVGGYVDVDNIPKTWRAELGSVMAERNDALREAGIFKRENERLKGELDHALLKIEALEETVGIREAECEEIAEDDDVGMVTSIDCVFMGQAPDLGNLAEAQGIETAEADKSEPVGAQKADAQEGTDHGNRDAESTFGASVLHAQRAAEARQDEAGAPEAQDDPESEESEEKAERMVPEDHGEGS